MKPLPTCDGLIIGGGPAGSMLAIVLAQAGKCVVVLEKTREARHKVCGEFLSPESFPLLRRAGICLERMGAVRIHSVRLVAREVIAEARLPAAAFSLTRRTLDEALLRRAVESGATVMRGHQVESVTRAQGSTMWQAQTACGDCRETISVLGRDAFLATGKHDLRGWPRNAKGAHNSLVAMKMYFRLSSEQQNQLADHVEILIYPGGYAGLQPVEGGCANLCALITRDKLQSLDGKWERLLDHMLCYSAHLSRRLIGAVPVLERPLALSAIPYGYYASALVDESAPWRVGDQAAVIPSFCGDGMAIALHTADRAAQMCLEEKNASEFQSEIRRKFGKRLGLSTLLSRMVIAAPSIAHAAKVWPSAVSGIFFATRVPGISFEPSPW